MRAALIPPKGYYHLAQKSNYHLMLAQIQDPDYIVAYGPEMDPSHYIIIDNGAAEGEMVRDSKLCERAIWYGVDEIVVPDVMEDAERTIMRGDRFWNSCKEARLDVDKYKFMGVVQSAGDLGSMIKCVHAFIEMRHVRVLGVPRHFVDKDKYARLNFLNWLRGSGYQDMFEVHLLGTNPKWPAEVNLIAQEHPWVRGVDSSLPFNYAIAGMPLNGKYVADGGIHRPTKYFELKRDIDESLLLDNIETFMRWASGTEGSQG